MDARIKVEAKKNRDRIERVCLSCDKPFMAYGRFNRICPKCRAFVKGAHWQIDGQYSSAIYSIEPEDR